MKHSWVLVLPLVFMSHQFEALFGNFLRKPGAKHEEALRVCSALGLRPPADYLAALAFTNGGEGFIGQVYFRLYSTEELLSLNRAYHVSRFTPGLVIFGSTGEGEAYAFDTRQTPAGLVKVPFIPLDFEFAEFIGNDFSVFLLTLAEADHGAEALGQPQIDMSAVGKEAHQRAPLAFGGDPVDPQNTVLVPSEPHAQICTFWNDVWQSKKATGAE
jgi:SMI1/KNR4 family protein SUKH-1